jgi:polysaccharide export outer membrane protein
MLLAFRRLAAVSSLAFVACAGNPRPVTTLPPEVLEPWTTQPGDMVRINVWREPELSGEVFVQNDGTAIFPALGRMHVGGLTADSLNGLLVARFRDRILNTPVDATLIRPLPVIGSVRSPGVYPVDPTATAIQVIARAGGTAGGERAPRVQLLRHDGSKLDLSMEQSLGSFNLRNGDALYVEERSFWLRNQRQITVGAAVSTILVSLVSVVIILSR